MTTFTASEVRELAATIWPDLSGREEVAETLNAYADRLEADDKAVPVAYALFTEKGLIRMWSREWFADAHGAPVNPTPLYVHPTPADTERLAEALRNLVSEWVAIADDGDATLEDSTIGYRACANRPSAMLAARSAQAQPPADQFDPERNVRPGDVGTEMQTAEQDAADFGTGFEVDGRRVAPERVRIFRGEHAAQPPAASVPDGLVDALRHQRQIDEDGAEVGVSRQAVDEAANILAMLAAVPQPPAARVPDWTDAQCVAFMAVGLRHTEYKKGKSPTVEEIRQGAKAALAAQENPND